MQKDPISANLSGRDNERLIAQFKNAAQYKINFLKFSTDVGVARNGGRKGAGFAPQVILNCFKKLATQNSNEYFNEIEIGNTDLELDNFVESQNKEFECIISNNEKIKSEFTLYLGGGHDHIYSVLKALEKSNPQKRLRIINLDPHLDTRIDQFYNSGTPFRQFANEALNEFDLYQVGIHPFANTLSSQLPLKNCHHKIISFNEIESLTKNFNNPEIFFTNYFKYDPKIIYVLSLDADAIHASTMEAVSAPNHHGLPCSFIEYCFKYFKEDCNCKDFGIFEYNPIYENLSLKGARFLSQLIYKICN